MTTASTVENHDDAGGDDGLAGLGAVLRQLLADGLGPPLGLDGDRRQRAAIERVARLGPEELSRQIDVTWRSEYRRLVGHARSKLGNLDDAEDVVQEAFRRVLQADPNFTQAGALKAYIWRAVQNEVVDRGTRMSRERAAREQDEPLDLDARLASRDRPLDEQICDRLTVVVLLDLLSPRERECILLRIVHGLSVKEVAARLGIAEGNVKRICHDLRARLAAAFEAAASPALG